MASVLNRAKAVKQGAIAGSIAEAFFGIPEELKAECDRKIEPEMRDVTERFYKNLKCFLDIP